PLKGWVKAFPPALVAPPPSYAPDTGDQRHPHLHPGRAARLVDAGGHGYGSVGEVHPAVAEALGLPRRPVIGAINLGQLLELVPAEQVAAPIPPAQPVDRDL